MSVHSSLFIYSLLLFVLKKMNAAINKKFVFVDVVVCVVTIVVMMTVNAFGQKWENLMEKQL